MLYSCSIRYDRTAEPRPNTFHASWFYHMLVFIASAKTAVFRSVETTNRHLTISIKLGGMSVQETSFRLSPAYLRLLATAIIPAISQQLVLVLFSNKIPIPSNQPTTVGHAQQPLAIQHGLNTVRRMPDLTGRTIAVIKPPHSKTPESKRLS